MSESDDDLMALAGMDSGEEVEEKEESDYEPEVTSSRRTTGGRKRKVDLSDDDGDDDGDDDDSEQDPYPLEGKFKDDADRAKLMAMDEVTREGILYDRMQEKETFNQNRYLALRARQSRAESSTLKRDAGSSNKKLRTSKLSELKKQRERKNKRDRKKYDDDDDEDDDLDDLAGDDDNDSDADLEALAGGFDNDDDEEYFSDEFSSRKSKKSNAQDYYDEKMNKDATLNDINVRVRSSRSVLSKFLYRAEFDTVIPGTYVRVNIGISRENGRPQYRMARVDGVKRSGKTYNLLGKPCDTYLIASQGEDKKSLEISCISDSPILPDEFLSYKKVLDKTSIRFVSLADVEKKFRELKDMSSKKLTNEDINNMVARKEAIAMDNGTRVKKIARLREEVQVAIEQANMSRVEELNKEIANLSKVLLHQTKTMSSMDRLNQRNKKTNETSIRRAEKMNVESRQKQLLNKSFNDPFSRLRTNAKLFYSSDIASKSEKAEETEAEKEEEKKEEKVELANCAYRRDGIDSVIKQIKFEIDLGF